MDVFFPRHITNDPDCTRMCASDLIDSLSGASDKRDTRTTVQTFPNERQPEARRTAGNRNTNPIQSGLWHRSLLHAVDSRSGVPLGASFRRTEATCPNGQGGGSLGN